MFDLNTILSAALTAAIAEAVKPLEERIEVLSLRIATLSAQDVAMGERIATLENNPAQGVDTTLADRIDVLADCIDVLADRMTQAEMFSKTISVTVPVSEEKMVEALNSQEWFWEKINRFVAERDSGAVLACIREAVQDDEDTKDAIRQIADGACEDAISEHCSDYDHDDYDRVSGEVNDFDLGDCVKSGDLEDAINDALSQVSFEVRVRT